MTRLLNLKIYPTEEPSAHPNLRPTHGKRKKRCPAADMTLRLYVARDLLIQSTMSVGEIAQQCGFTSTSYFIRTFRKTFGTTPGKWRRDVRIES